ncbi:MAG: hypothetical protein ACR2MA_10845, partial [Egibacteraceae bacterium]
AYNPDPTAELRLRREPTDGTARWTAGVGRTSAADVTVHVGAVYVVTTTAVLALDLGGGQRRWWRPLPASPR